VEFCEFEKVRDYKRFLCKFLFRWALDEKLITDFINPSNAELNPICHLLALFGAHHIFHISGLRVK